MDIQAVKTLPDAQTLTSVTPWTDTLFSFRVSRPQSLRFRSGEFVMICGSLALNKDIMWLCEAQGLIDGANSNPAEFVVERALVD